MKTRVLDGRHISRHDKRLLDEFMQVRTWQLPQNPVAEKAGTLRVQHAERSQGAIQVF
jgi:hypothetical protein